MKLTIAFLLCIFSFNFADAQTRDYWQQQTNYEVAVSLNETDHSLDADYKLTYFNNSPDTLTYIWFHLWPNAYKNDKTAFSEQLLKIGRTDFYFSHEEDRGYINRLDFKVNDNHVKIKDHPQHQDIVQVFLDQPLPPGNSAIITTPFHVKLPKIFSRSGYQDSSYQITQWYPKPAVYDAKGWHEMPYLDQGEFFSEFGNFEVDITVPSGFVVAATGKMTNETSNGTTETYHFTQDNVHDFAWFADRRFILKTEEIQTNNGSLTVMNYVLPGNEDIWEKSLKNTENAILSKEKWIGTYPYNTVTVVDNIAGAGGGMEYPTITVLAANSATELDLLINHEVGHNWFYGILATNERSFPWMDEGMNSYYDKRYEKEYMNKGDSVNDYEFKNKLPLNDERTILQTLIFLHKDQPISTASEKFSYLNYNLVAYEKAAGWLQLLEIRMGKPAFDSMMHSYYETWKFKHPYPADFRAIAEKISGQDLSETFALLDEKGYLVQTVQTVVKPTFLFNLNQTRRTHYISFLPAAGYNFYDKLMIGGLVHNYNLPPTKFQFLVAPLYATGSKKLNGLGRISYTFFPNHDARKLQLAAAYAHFTGDSFTDSTGTKNYQPFTKFAPSIKYIFGNRDPLGSSVKFIQLKSFFIEETGLSFTRDPITQQDKISYPKTKRYLNQLQFGIQNYRVLYPYEALLKAEQAKGFIRLAFTGNYFFNYPKSGGFNLRFFAGKFIYTTDKTFRTQSETDRYHLNLSGPKGYEDYTYEDYFYGRNEFDGFAARQIMNRDGAFKVKTDFLSNKIGKSDDWLTSLNLTTTIPDKINPLSLLPVKIPIKIFVDIGTYAEAWDDDRGSGRFLYDAGLQVSLFYNVLNVYFPLVYSKVYDNYFKSTIPGSTFKNNIVFSIEFKNLQPRKIFPALGL